MNIKKADYMVALERAHKEGYEKGKTDGRAEASAQAAVAFRNRRLVCIEKASDSLVAMTEMAARIAVAAQTIDKS